MTPGAPRVVVVVPTYNERENLPLLVPAILEHGYGVLVVDDSSPDGTGDVADELATEHQRVEVLHRSSSPGLGPAYSEGFRLAAERSAEVICGMDCDFSHDPAALPELVAPLAAGAADMAIGSRYVPGGATPDWPLRRRLLSRYGNAYARFMLKLTMSDATSGYRAYTAPALAQLDPASCEATGYLFLVELASRAVRRGLRVEEVPITFRDRQYGESKMGGRIVLEAMWLVTLWGLGRRLLRR